MEKENFMTILHEGEKMDEMVLDEVKGGACDNYCICNKGSKFEPGECPNFGI